MKVLQKELHPMFYEFNRMMDKYEIPYMLYDVISQPFGNIQIYFYEEN